MTTRAVARWLLAALLLTACGRAPNPGTQRLADGTYRVVCRGPLTECLKVVEDVCKGGPYDVVTARDERLRYGSEHGSSQGETRSSEARVRCTSELRPLLFGGNDQPAAVDPAASPPPTPGSTAGSPGPATRACVPGATQACTGPGACAGGQACLPDGSAYGPCDCGTLTAPSSAAPAAPTTGADTAPAASSAPGMNSGANTPSAPKAATAPKTPSPSGAATPAPMPRPGP
ncbi:MAG TPA: hypothetical protein VER33_09555 [Polyangiaceae bacterium]|nr:hypothetical protein [Polyangiaceae bacterium]